MHQGKSESIAPSSGTSRGSGRLTLSVRLTPSLISAGLARGITLMLARRLSGQKIPGIAIYAPDGSVVDIPRQAFISWKE